MRWPWGRTGEVACPQCGASAPADARWCGTCGAALSLEEDVPHHDEVPTERRGEGRTGRVVAAGLVLAVLGGLLVAQATAEQPEVPAGFMSRGDGARSGVVSRTPIAEPDGVAWRVAVELPPLLTPGADVLGTTVADGRELVVVHDPAEAGRRITTHDAATGEVVATTMLPLGSPPHDLSMADGLLAHADLTSVTLVDLATGEQRWRLERRLRGDVQLTPHGVVGTPAASQSLDVVLLSLEDGSEQWRTTVAEDGGTSRLLHTADAIVVATSVSDGAAVTGLAPATGEVRWRRDAGNGLPQRGATFPLAPLSASAGRVLVPGSERTVLLDGSTGTIHPVLPLPTASFAVAVAAVEDDLVVASDGSGSILAVEVGGSDGPVVRWTAPSPVSPLFSLAITGDHVAVRGDNGTALLDLAAGESVAPVAPAGGTARLVTTSDGGVARLTTDAGVELVDADGVRWRAPTVAVHLPDLATDERTVAITTPDGVEVFEVDDGFRRLAHQAFEPALVDAASLNPPVLLGGKVTIAPPESQPPDRGGVLALFSDTGIVDWTRTGDRVVPRGTPVVDRDLVVLPVGSQLLGFDRASGRRSLVVETTIARTDLAAAGGWLAATDAPRDAGDLWVGRRSTRELLFRAPIRTCAPPVLHQDVVIVVDHLGDIIARELATGEQPWGEKARGSACRPLSIAGDVVIALVGDRELLAVTLDDGETAWRLQLPDHAAGAPVVAGDQVLVPTLAGEVLAYDVLGQQAPDGPAWRVDVGAVPAGSVAVEGDTLLVVTREGELVALR